MRALFFSVLGYFLTPVGIVVMGFLDASMVFFMPLGIDFVAILMTARRPGLFWLWAILATIGSTLGAAATFWIGRKVGEHGLSKLVSGRRLEQVRKRVSEGAAVSVALLAIIPPPFPFTPFVLTSGALDMDPWVFLGTLAGVRALRFGAETLAAHFYGRVILKWMETPTFKAVVGVFIGLALIGTVVSAIALIRHRGTKSGNEGPQPPRRTPTAATDLR